MKKIWFVLLLLLSFGSVVQAAEPASIQREQEVFSESEWSPEELVAVTSDHLYFVRAEKLLAYDRKKGQIEIVHTFGPGDQYQIRSTEDYCVLVSRDPEKEENVGYYFKGKEKKTFFRSDNRSTAVPQCFTAKGNIVYVWQEVFLETTNRFHLKAHSVTWHQLGRKFWREDSASIEVWRLLFAEGPNGEYGRQMVAVGGDSKGIYMGVVEAVDGRLENAKEMDLFYYELEKGSIEDWMDKADLFRRVRRMKLPYLGIYVTGIGEYFLTNEYLEARPVKVAGHLYRQTEDGFETLRNFPEIESGSDILESMTVDDHLLFCNRNTLFLINLQDKEPETTILKGLGRVILTPTGAYYMEKEGSSTVLHHVSVPATKEGEE